MINPEIIQKEINSFIQSLYNENGNITEEDLNKYDIDLKEPINWGDLGCSEVTQPRMIAIIDEASPGECPSLCNAIEKHIQDKLGIEIEVVTEW